MPPKKTSKAAAKKAAAEEKDDEVEAIMDEEVNDEDNDGSGRGKRQRRELKHYEVSNITLIVKVVSTPAISSFFPFLNCWFLKQIFFIYFYCDIVIFLHYYIYNSLTTLP
ncbi:MAG: hypothetical protein ACI90V_005065 [Bacillariaceae sp.]|jgi:hypothetical protein